MDIKSKLHSIIKNPNQQAIERLSQLPMKVLADELNGLEKRIVEEHNKAIRTISPVRLLLSIDAFLLLQAGDKLTISSDKDGRPAYKGLICHPSVFHSTDINPYQFLILG